MIIPKACKFKLGWLLTAFTWPENVTGVCWKFPRLLAAGMGRTAVRERRRRLCDHLCLCPGLIAESRQSHVLLNWVAADYSCARQSSRFFGRPGCGGLLPSGLTRSH